MKKVKDFLSRLFIDGLSGMALGLFATLIIGTIICQIGSLVGGDAGKYINYIGSVAKSLTGAGIGIGVACKLKQSPLVCVSAAVAGLIGAFPGIATEAIAMGKPGEPLGAFVAAYIAIECGNLISGKTKLDIILTPIVAIIPGAVAGIFVGPYISKFMLWIGEIVNINVEKQPIIGGIIVAVVMGILLTLPISSAAIGISTGLTGLAAGAAVMGCCCNMVGFAVASYRENKVGGLIAQGIGTSMIQMPNIVKKPIIWLPAVISSAIMGPVSSAVVKMQCSPIGSGMGTSGLVGQIDTFTTMTANGTSATVVLIEIICLQIIVPGIIAFAVSEGMRKLGLIKKGDMLLTM